MNSFSIDQNVKKILEELPSGVELVAACKTRRPDQISAAIDAGIRIVAQNYVQEAEEAFAVIGRRAKWHFIGHLQKNKVKKAVQLFDMIETIDSVRLAEEVDKRSRLVDKVMPVLVEVNSAREKQKFGVFPEKVQEVVEGISKLRNIKVLGLMTMGSFSPDPNQTRPYFIETRKCFEEIKSAGIIGIEMRYLSMGMTNSYHVAIEEGANMVRIGTKIFGEREN